MFKNLLKFWKGKDFITDVLDSFDSMIKLSQEMYVPIIRILVKGEKIDGDLKDTIYKKDQKINELERLIRRRIVEHLALQPTVDVPVCLVLMSVVKDAERIGDYCKNLYEIVELHHGPFNKELYEKYLDAIDENILDLFSKTRKAFKESDEKSANYVIDTNKDNLKFLNDALKKIAASSLSARDAVCLATTTRFFRRIAAHLGNIASSVIVPVPDLDYFDEQRK